MSFLWTQMLWLLLLLPVLIIGYILVQRRRKKYALRYASLNLVKEALGHGPGFRRHIPAILFLIAVLVIVVALARPVATTMLPSQRGTIILTLDVSGSMRADDIKPSRMEAAQSAARSFVENQPENVRIGVVSFSESAALVQAPTTDRQAVLAAINRLTPQRGTAIGYGILTSLDAIFEDLDLTSPDVPSGVLGQPPEPTLTQEPVPLGSFAPAVIVLLSDGESNRGPPPLEIIDRAANPGIRVYTVGLGSPEGAVLRFWGRSIRVRLDEETLRGIAQSTEASYYKAESETDLSNIYESLSTRLVFKAEQTEITALFTAMAALLLLIAGTLSLLWFNRLL